MAEDGRRSADPNRTDESTIEEIREDPFVSHLGIEFTTLEPGRARATLTVEPWLCNFHGTLHGGVVHALADAAAAAAENVAGNRVLGLETNTSYLAPVEAGDTVVATAENTHAGSTTTETLVAVERESGERVATFRGRGYVVSDG